MNDAQAMSAMKENLSDQGYEVEEFDRNTNLPESGMMQTKSPYSTAIQVTKPRNLNLVEQRCLQEAARAGDEFYYSWSQGGSIIEGVTIGAAQMLARNWGNCAIDVRVSETPNGYVFYGAFIDLETGFNLVRPFKMTKQSPKNKQGRDIYSGDRGRDIIFQIGASKATRNVITNALPKWLIEKVLDQAKQNIIGKIEKMGKEKAIQKLVQKAEALKIPLDRIEANYGKKEKWDIDKVVAVMGAVRSVEDGIESLDEVFAEKTSVNGEPEIKDRKGTSSEKKKEESPKEETDWEDVNSVAKAISKLETTKDYNAFKKDNKQRLESFGGKEAEYIEQLIDEKENELLKQ